MGEPNLARAYDAGRGLALEEAVAFALSEEVPP